MDIANHSENDAPVNKDITTVGVSMDKPCTIQDFETQPSEQPELSNVEHKLIGPVPTKESIEQLLTTNTVNALSPININSEGFLSINGAWRDYVTVDTGCTKGCKWAPDGSCLLTNCDDNTLRIYNLPEKVLEMDSWVSNNPNESEMLAALKMKEGGCIFDYAWYPLMNSMSAATSCLVSCSRKCPIHLWDAYSGSIRASYIPINQVDEVVGATSVCFSPDGLRLYSGYDNRILRIFDTSRPGRQCEERVLKGGLLENFIQTGIISTIAVNPTETKMYACGSYGKAIGIYAEPEGSQLMLLRAHSGGLTQVQFSPDGSKLYSGGRKDSEIICWDTRNLGSRLGSYPREVNTFQRIYFDISKNGQYLFTGNTSGQVSVWDHSNALNVGDQSTAEVFKPNFTFQPHHDATNGISIHPFCPILATTSGQRHLPATNLEEDPAADEAILPSSQKDAEFSMKLWWMGSVP